MADRIFNVRMLASVLHRVHTDALDLTAVSLESVGSSAAAKPTKFHLIESVAEYKCMHRQNLTPGSLSGAAGAPGLSSSVAGREQCLAAHNGHPTQKLQALVYDILPGLEEGAGKRCSECCVRSPIRLVTTVVLLVFESEYSFCSTPLTFLTTIHALPMLNMCDCQERHCGLRAGSATNCRNSSIAMK